MGVFDFLYKSKPKAQAIPRNYRQSAPSSHFKQRTVTYVNRSNSLPDDEPTTRTNVQPQNHHRQKSSNRSYHYQRGQNKPSQKQNNIRKDHEIDVIDYYNQSKQNVNNDDFTRLSRLEVKIDNYITRHKEISDELQNIELNLGLIRKEFAEEFHNDILSKGNKHVIEIGQRILAKLESFKDVPQANRHINDTHHQERYESKSKETEKKHYDTKKYTETAKKVEVQVNGSEQHESKPPPLPASPPPPDQLVNSKPLAHSTFAENGHHQSYHSSPFNGHFSPESGTIAKAKYMVVQDSYTTNISPIVHYKSTPVLAKPVEGYQNNQQQRYAVDDTYSNSRHFSPDPGATRLYLNMSMTMHSDHPVIEHCFRRIELLRPRIMHYKSEHKLRVYKDLDGEIIHLMNKLEALECHSEPFFQQDKNVALCELHNLAGILERSIECRDPECIICNSFIYKPEVSV